MLDRIQTLCNEALTGLHHKNTTEAIGEMHYALKSIRDLVKQHDPAMLAIATDNLTSELKEEVPMNISSNRALWRGYVNILKETIKEVDNELDYYPR